MKPEILQNLEKDYCAYRTGNKVGIVKAPRPPYVPRFVLRPVPKRKSKGWFILEPLKKILKL